MTGALLLAQSVGGDAYSRIIKLFKSFNMKKALFAVIGCILCFASMAQSENSNLNDGRDSALRAAIHRDSMKIENQYAEKARFQKLLKMVEYPALNGGKFSGVFPVSDISEFPDASMQYKLLYECNQRNPDSLLNKPDRNLVEIARVINMHVAAGVPLKNISVIIVLHGGGDFPVLTNATYRRMLEKDNPNLKLVEELENIGAKFIVCGQSMNFIGLNKNDLLPGVKIAYWAQTTFTTYQLKGYVLKTMNNDK